MGEVGGVRGRRGAAAGGRKCVECSSRREAFVRGAAGWKDCRVEQVDAGVRADADRAQRRCGGAAVVGRLLFSGSGDCCNNSSDIREWDVGTGQYNGVLEGRVTSLGVIGSRLLSWSRDGTVRVWGMVGRALGRRRADASRVPHSGCPSVMSLLTTERSWCGLLRRGSACRLWRRILKSRNSTLRRWQCAARCSLCSREIISSQERYQNMKNLNAGTKKNEWSFMQ